MSRLSLRTPTLAFLAALLLAASQAWAERSVILIIGDGMDDQQVTIARNYLEGADGKLRIDDMPVRSTAQVLTVSEQEPPAAVYVADSANSGTAMATGQTTSRGRISTSPVADRDIPTIAELAKAAGYRTGIVSTASVTDATPAVFAAHIAKRRCENPLLMQTERNDCTADMKASGGPGSISEQLAESSVDVLLGGGRSHFSPMAEGADRTVLQVAQDNGFHVIESLDALDAAPRMGKLLGLFATRHLAVRLRGENGRIAEEPEVSLLGRIFPFAASVTLPEPMVCEPNPDAADTPSLAAMTETAIDRLSRSNRKGFFLMVESASIDKAAHGRNPCGSIGELQQLDEAAGVALAYASANPRTLVLVTADHGHAAQIIPQRNLFAAYGLFVYTPGSMARLKTKDGSVMGVNYATSTDFPEQHTGTAVPVYANDAGKDIPAYITQPMIFDIAKQHLGI